MKDTNRLEAFSDGVLAIIITIMVLKIDVPNETTFSALTSLIPVFLSYLLSFIYLGIYWNNHHHMFKITKEINGSILWANLNLLFWLSLFPFSTSWMGGHLSATIPAVLYGAILLLAALAWWILQRLIIIKQGQNSLLGRVMGNSHKEKISLLLYLMGIILAFFRPWISYAIYAGVAIIWIVPDKRVERALKKKQEHQKN